MKHIYKWDGHTHTHYCRHGADASVKEYVKRAVELGFERYSITEHPPLPDGYLQNADVMSQLAMPFSELDRYVADMQAIKQAFAGQIDVRVGLEIDFLPNFEGYTRALLARVEHTLDEVLVSVHFLPGRDGMRCIDLSPDDFMEGLVAPYGSVASVIDAYFDHVEKAVAFAATLALPVRIGHLALIEKFRDALPAFDDALVCARLTRLLPLIKAAGVGVDCNVAGFRKATCRRPYVPAWWVTRARDEGIPLVFGSDAHAPGDVGADWDWFEQVMQGCEVFVSD
ncbi:histidinol-phosphatase HisJ [Ferroacidibacillus organovorans]|uniref:Histidinol-phosphatase n=1 Tax=Ferroacidibacillus organovorans TaxID=1765683 RepID=A0A124IVM7_9BACL|nr:histidinol-phosphatase HisJ [Ferroacidibacillus organovorans]KUO94726.1 histidinol-phosphatase [Ferroacidibacillus organovorans]